MVASRKAACGSQGDKQSDIVAKFASEICGGSASSSAAVPKVVSSAGFVPSTAATQAEKEKQRDWDRSAILKVNEDDTQVQIYQAYAQNANTNAEGVSSRRGLGAGSEPAGAHCGRGMTFVSAGGAPANTPAGAGGMAFVAAGDGAVAPAAAVAPAPAAAPSAPAGSALPPGWVAAADPTSGYTYYCCQATGVTQWHPPAPEPPPSAQLPAGWMSALDPSSGRTYYCCQATGVTQWHPPPPNLAAAPPVAAGSAAAVAAAPRPSGASVRIRGLPSTMGEAEVRELFSTCGRIVRVYLDRADYSASQAPKSGVVSFDVLASAEVAVKQMDGTKLRQQTLSVSLASEHGGRPY